MDLTVRVLLPSMCAQKCKELIVKKICELNPDKTPEDISQRVSAEGYSDRVLKPPQRKVILRVVVEGEDTE